MGFRMKGFYLGFKERAQKQVEVSSVYEMVIFGLLSLCLHSHQMLQKRWIELENRLRLISFSRPDKRDAIEDELRSIEVSLRSAATS